MVSWRGVTRWYRLLLRLVWIGVSVVVVLALWSAWQAWSTRYPLYPSDAPARPGVWRGAYHVHTVASRDGHGTIDDVVDAARGAGLDWVLVTDHNLVDLPAPEYRRGILVVQAVESSTIHGHLVLLGSRRGLERKERRGPVPLEVASSLGGAQVAAHPLNRRRPFRRLDDPSIVGMEVLSLDDAFREALKTPLRLVQIGWAYPFNSAHALFRMVHEPTSALRRWDELLSHRPVVAFGALDAHGRPPYDGPFRTLSMYALVGRAPTGIATADADALIRALVAGRSYLCLESFASGRGFLFEAVTQVDDAHYAMGEPVPFDRDPLLRIQVGAEPPPGVEVRVVCAGRAFPVKALSAPGSYEYRPADRGACRAEIWSPSEDRRRPWVLSNPIWVR